MEIFSINSNIALVHLLELVEFACVQNYTELFKVTKHLGMCSLIAPGQVWGYGNKWV